VRKLPPKRCVVDTNVAVTANGDQAGISPACVNASAEALQQIMSGGHLFVDEAGLIVGEYCQNLSRKGQPGPGDAFLKWVLTHEWGGKWVTRVRLTPLPEHPAMFEELPAPRRGIRYDPSDCKFLAVAAVDPRDRPILQATDSKWWGWQESLSDAGVSIYFLCPEIEQKHREKMGR